MDPREDQEENANQNSGMLKATDRKLSTENTLQDWVEPVAKEKGTHSCRRQQWAPRQAGD